MPVIQLSEIQTLLKDLYFSTADNTLFRQIEDEAVLLHISNGMYYSLNQTGILFWEALRDRQPLQIAIDRVLSTYDADLNQVLQDLQKFLERLLDYELILAMT